MPNFSAVSNPILSPCVPRLEMIKSFISFYRVLSAIWLTKSGEMGKFSNDIVNQNTDFG